MAYTFTIASQEELESLQFLSERYNYATVLERILDTPADAEWSIDSERYPVDFTVAEHKAWEFSEAVEAEDGYLTCLGGRLLDEVQSFLNRIV